MGVIVELIFKMKWLLLIFAFGLLFKLLFFFFFFLSDFFNNLIFIFVLDAPKFLIFFIWIWLNLLKPSS